MFLPIFKPEVGRNAIKVGRKIRWWHRNIARTDFAINGFINH